MFQGNSLRVLPLGEGGFFELCFDRNSESINKFDNRTVDELRQAIRYLKLQANLRGVLVTSAKEVFIVGADITEFGAKFAQSAKAIAADVRVSNEAFVEFEDLPVPTVVAINGFALGGGLEFALTCTHRIMSTEAKIGLPEVKLGLFPGFGGTVRLVRIAGPEVACAWVSSGTAINAETAKTAGVVDDVVLPEELRSRAIQWLERSDRNKINWQTKLDRKRNALALPIDEAISAFQTARHAALKKVPAHQPAAIAAIDMMAKGAQLNRKDALDLEAEVFGQIARTQAAASMVQTFLNEQVVKKIARKVSNGAPPVQNALVLGAGIMGGGIAVTSATRKIPVLLNDLRQSALDQGMVEAKKQLNRQINSGRLSQEKGDKILATIRPQLDLKGVGDVDVVIEAIVENLEVKRKVLGDLEPLLNPDAILASNTSSLRIDDIGITLKNPKRFVGMHFFNPVHMMPLVEVVRGEHTSDITIARAVAYATAMGKVAIVVNDCPGFLVNRVFTAYMRGFLQLVADGANFEHVDQAMESFGWPMGPAYLEDVIGMDTGSHVNDVISAGYPDRMRALEDDALRLMVRAGRLGQKNGIGFYRYEPSATGKPTRITAEDTHELLSQLQPNGLQTFSDELIIDRMMLPMVLEAIRALHDGIVNTAAEVDMAMQLGLGFPSYAAGPLKYADWLGLTELVRRCDALQDLGPAYSPSDRLRQMASCNELFYPINN